MGPGVFCLPTCSKNADPTSTSAASPKAPTIKSELLWRGGGGENGRWGTLSVVLLATCAAGALYLVFPITPLTAQVVMMGFLALALACVYGLGRRLADVETGLWAAFLLATAPFVVFSLTNFQLDLPLAAMVALTLYALFRAEDFGRPGWSLALGAAVGLGMLTKPPFAAYVGPPLLWSLGRALASSERRRRLLWAAGALAMGAALALPWYGPRLFGLPAQMLNRSFKQAAEQQNPDPLTAAALSFYPRTLPTQFGLVAALLLLWGLWALGKERRTTRGFLWLATLGPFVLFSLIQNKNLRYTLPILPAAVLVAAMGLRALPSGWRRVAGAGALAAGVLQVSMTLWALPPPPTLPGMILPLAIGRPPSGADWQHDLMVGNVTQVILPNMQIDDYVFGIAAVDAQGHESLVSPYVSTPRPGTPVKTVQ